MGMPMSVLKEDKIFDRVVSIKYDVPNDRLDLFDTYKKISTPSTIRYSRRMVKEEFIMAIEYLGLSEGQWPSGCSGRCKNASYEEIVEFTVDGNEKNWDVSLLYTKIKPLFRYLREPRACLLPIPIPV